MSSSSLSTGIKKLQEEHIQIKKSGILATIQGTVAPIKKNKQPDYLHWRGNICGSKIHLIVMDYIILK